MTVSLIEGLPSITGTIREYGLAPKKSLGQNFLTDLNITRKIVRLAGKLDQTPILEIGPGPGALTRALLLEGATSVLALEKDGRSLKALSSLVEASQGCLQVLEQNALAVDWNTICDRPYKIVANLPYNISTVLLAGWLEPNAKIQQMTLMFQKEVADRITAEPGSKTYGRLSVISQYHFHPTLDMVLPPHVFHPAPKVHSAIVNFYPRPGPFEAGLWEKLKKVTRYAFAQRRKMIKNQLKPLSFDVEKWLESLGIDPKCRAEDLDVETFCRLAHTLPEGNNA